jgi:hypothetical protein
MTNEPDQSGHDCGFKECLLLTQNSQNGMQETHGIQRQRESQQLNVHGGQYSSIVHSVEKAACWLPWYHWLQS